MFELFLIWNWTLYSSILCHLIFDFEKSILEKVTLDFYGLIRWTESWSHLIQVEYWQWMLKSYLILGLISKSTWFRVLGIEHYKWVFIRILKSIGWFYSWRMIWKVNWEWKLRFWFRTTILDVLKKTWNCDGEGSLCWSICEVWIDLEWSGSICVKIRIFWDLMLLLFWVMNWEQMIDVKTRCEVKKNAIV